eukprot:349916-Chlamydomonas_euryale.AAC.3
MKESSHQIAAPQNAPSTADVRRRADATCAVNAHEARNIIMQRRIHHPHLLPRTFTVFIRQKRFFKDAGTVAFADLSWSALMGRRRRRGRHQP